MLKVYNLVCTVTAIFILRHTVRRMLLPHRLMVYSRRCVSVELSMRVTITYHADIGHMHNGYTSTSPYLIQLE